MGCVETTKSSRLLLLFDITITSNEAVGVSAIDRNANYQSKLTVLITLYKQLKYIFRF